MMERSRAKRCVIEISSSSEQENGDDEGGGESSEESVQILGSDDDFDAASTYDFDDSASRYWFPILCLNSKLILLGYINDLCSYQFWIIWPARATVIPKMRRKTSLPRLNNMVMRISKRKVRNRVAKECFSFSKV